MLIKLNECPVCKQNNWHDLDYLRGHKYWYDRDYVYDEPVGMKVCKECGFVTYDYRDEETLKNWYENYRQIIDVGSIVTTFRKLEYHKEFLKDIDFQGKYVLDYGCGIGYFLNWIKDNTLYDTVVGFKGVEINEILRKYAKYEYGLDVTADIPDEKFDFISCYRVLEHIQHPDNLIQQFRDHLSDDGLLYISVPCNIREDLLDEDAGLQTAEFEEFYHMHHVNVFSKQSFKNLLLQYGFEIIKENDIFYGYTVLCKKSLVNKSVENEDYQKVISILKKQKKAMELFKEEKFEEARTLHTGYVDAWSMNAAKNFKDLAEQERVIKEGLAATNNNYKLKRQLAFLYYQWTENMKGEHSITNHIKESKRLWEELIAEKPGMEDYYYYLGMIYAKYYKDYDKAKEMFLRTLEINPTKWGEVQNLLGWIHKIREN